MDIPQDLTCSHSLSTSHESSSSDSSSSQCLKTQQTSPTFSLFSQLPPEIRLKIWTLTITPRIISLTKVDSKSITSTTPIPPILHTTRESRYESLRYYRLSLSTLPCLSSAATTTPPSSPPPKVFVAPNLDTLYIPRYRAMGYDETLRDFKSYLSHPEELNSIQELALDYVEMSEKRPWEAYDKAVLIRSFPNLARVSLVMGEKPEVAVRGAVRGKEDTQVVFEDAVVHLRAKGVAEVEATRRVQRMESEFRAAWEMEEGIAREVAFGEGRGDSFEKWILPELRLVGKEVGCGYLRVL